MPFPLAHPAAVVPLKRFWPKWFSLAALIVGSLSPDFGYCFGPLKVDEFSHSLVGTFVFCLPAGLLVLWMFYRTRTRLIRMAPASFQISLQQLCLKPAPSALMSVASLMIGAWTHVLWDAFTHKQGWFVLHSPLLQTPVGFVLGHKVRVFHLLWYLSSFAGVGWLFLVFDRWLERIQGVEHGMSTGVRFSRALVIATVTLLFAAIHHLAAHWNLFYCASLVSVVVVLGVWLKLAGLARTSNRAPSKIE